MGDGGRFGGGGGATGGGSTKGGSGDGERGGGGVNQARCNATIGVTSDELSMAHFGSLTGSKSPPVLYELSLSDQ